MVAISVFKNKKRFQISHEVIQNTLFLNYELLLPYSHLQAETEIQ